MCFCFKIGTDCVVHLRVIVVEIGAAEHATGEGGGVGHFGL